MKNLLKLLVITLTVMTIACSTSQRYYKPLSASPTTPWKGSSAKWGGYKETTKNGEYNISYHAFNKPNAEAAAYFAKLRAAERTIINGKRYFRISKPLMRNTVAQNSYFPAYVIPGYWDRERYRHCEECPNSGKEECHYDYEDVWYPEEFVPAKNVINYIHTATLSIKFNRLKQYNSTVVDAHQFVADALANKAGYGKPKLHPAVINALANKKS